MSMRYQLMSIRMNMKRKMPNCGNAGNPVWMNCGKKAAEMLTMYSSAVMQTAMLRTAHRQPKQAPRLITSSLLGPGVAEITNVTTTKIHHACRPMQAPVCLLWEKLADCAPAHMYAEHKP
jgi:hypothetical protein